MTPGDFDLSSALVSLVMAMGLGFALSALYTATYQGVSYLKGFAQTLALTGLASAGVMLCVGDSIARGIGLFGAVNLVQFRSTLKDTRDLMFVFVTLVSGVACGVGAYLIALVTVALFAVAIGFQHVTDFGTRTGVSAVLRVRAKTDALARVPVLLAKHSRRAILASSRSTGADEAEQTFQLRLQGLPAQAALLAALPEAGVGESSLLLQDDSIEV